MAAPLTRRRAIVILAAAFGFSPLTARSAPEAVRWRGVMLGAPCAIDLYHPDRGRAKASLDAALAAARRLEGLFSLYQPQSALRQLNRAGALVAPAPDFVALLRAAQDYTRLTGGAFDPTVQPFFTLLSRHFSTPDADPNGPSQGDWEAARARVGAHHLIVADDRVVLLGGAQVTLNGIAQGYVTDRVASIFAEAGLANALVDMGEIRALGARPDGAPWSVGLEAPDGAIWKRIDCKDRAVATSAGGGFVFDRAGRFNHIFDPGTGACAHRSRAVAVAAPTATAADALSTAFTLLPPEEIIRISGEIEGVTTHLAA
ncbi:FAD:protein FMN transferase [Methylocystis parvus]|uniref:FAD:protein FMN transferase n=1 Tax=Methylocystis parvus TaxID=134 RepID=UPI003C7720A6